MFSWRNKKNISTFCLKKKKISLPGAMTVKMTIFIFSSLAKWDPVQTCAEESCGPWLSWKQKVYNHNQVLYLPFIFEQA